MPSPWDVIFSIKNIKLWQIPSVISLNKNNEELGFTLDKNGIARGLVIRWTKLRDEFKRLNPAKEDQLFYVVCDVLILDDVIGIENDLYIFARQIEVVGDNGLFLDSAAGTATLVTQAITDRNGANTTIPVGFLPEGASDAIIKPLQVIPDSPATLFSICLPEQITAVPWGPNSETASKLSEFLRDDEPLHLGLVTTFQVATIFASTSDVAQEIIPGLMSLKLTLRDIAIHQLRWVSALASVSKSPLDFAIQAQSILTWLVNTNQGTLFVPPFDFEIYSDSAKVLLDILRIRSDKYEKWIDLKRDATNWLDQARLTVQLEEGEAALQANLKQNAQIKLSSAKAALSEGAYQLKGLSSELDKTTADFQDGIEQWEEDRKREEAFKIVKNIFTLGIAVGKVVAMVALPGAGAAAAGGTGAAASGAGTTAGSSAAGSSASSASSTSSAAGPSSAGTSANGARAGSTTSSAVGDAVEGVKKAAGPMGEAIGAVSGIVESVQAIQQVGRTADALNNMAENTLAEVNKTTADTSYIHQLQGLDTVTGGMQIWKSLATGMDDIFQTQEALLNAINGGAAFRVAFKQLIVGAEAYCSARLAVANATNALAEAILRTQTAKNSLALVQSYESNVERKIEAYNKLQQIAFNRLLDSKRALYVELQNYQHAIAYYTLSADLPGIPSITSSVDAFIANSALVSGYKLALEKLNPKPTTFQLRTFQLPMTQVVVTSDNNVKTFIFQIQPDDEQLREFSRVRIDRLEIQFFNDVAPIYVKKLHISTNGVYIDKVPRGGIVQFVSDPWERDPVYDSNGGVISGMESTPRFAEAMFKPTPFTTWTIATSNQDDIKKLESAHTIQLSLIGEATTTD